VPDTISEGASTNTSYTGLPQGLNYFHVRAKDNAGNWGAAKHYTLQVDTGLPSDPSISSSSHTRDACSTSSNPSFSWSSSDSTSGVAGYGTAFDQSSGTTPPTSSVSTLTGGTFSAPSDGDWWMHVRAKDKATNLSGTSHYKVRINATPPAAPSIGSSSHGDGVWSSNRTFSINWSLSDFFGVGGYSYILDQSSSTTPDTTSEGTGTSYSTSGLTDGTWYFHVRGLDGCGSWGATRHYTVRVDGTQSSAPTVTSSSHPSDSAWYSDRSPSFSFGVSDTSGVDGYSYLVDTSPFTTPDTASEGASSTYTASGLGDGTHYFHVRARNGAGLWSDAGHRGVKIDGTPPLGPTVSSSTHPDALTDYPNNDPSLSWSAPSDLSGIDAYSYVLDQVSGTTPDTISEGVATSKGYQDLADGVYYFHIRARDVAGNWGSVTHRRIGVSVPAPHVVPTLSAPSGQLDPDGKPVVKDGDLLTFSGPITEESGAGASSDPAAVVAVCNLVVKDAAAAVVKTISVPLTSCRNSNGSLVGSFAPSVLGAARGTVHLEVEVQRTASGVTKSSGTQKSGTLLVDNDVPAMADAVMGCYSDEPSFCDDSRTILVELSEPVKGDFLAADFTVSGSLILAAQASCTSTTYCDEVVLTLNQAMDASNPPSVTYSFLELTGRSRPKDGPGHLLGGASLAVRNLDGGDDVDVDATFFADDPLDPAVELPSSPAGNILVVDDNAFQAYADKGTTPCPTGKFVDTEGLSEEDKKCGESGRERRLAQRIAALGRKPLGTDDGMTYAPDVILLQEVRTVDAQNIAGHLNRKTNLDGARCNSSDPMGRCYKVAISTADAQKSSNGMFVKSETAIIYNRRLLMRNKTATFKTSYTKEEACVPKVDALTGEVIFVDEDLDGLNDCGKKRTVKKHHLALFSEKVMGGLTVAVASIHFVTPSHLKKNDTIHDAVKSRWAQRASTKLQEFAGSADIYSIGGDFNIKRCASNFPLGEDDDGPESVFCLTREWWTSLTGISHNFDDSVYVRNRTQDEMNEQYKNGTSRSKKRIDFIFTRNTTLTEPSGASKDFTCGLGDQTPGREENQLTCRYLTNTERYSDHNLIWSLVGR
jgi:hypothetical protein